MKLNSLVSITSSSIDIHIECQYFYITKWGTVIEFRAIRIFTFRCFQFFIHTCDVISILKMCGYLHTFVLNSQEYRKRCYFKEVTLVPKRHTYVSWIFHAIMKINYALMENMNKVCLQTKFQEAESNKLWKLFHEIEQFYLPHNFQRVQLTTARWILLFHLYNAIKKVYQSHIFNVVRVPLDGIGSILSRAIKVFSPFFVLL